MTCSRCGALLHNKASVRCCLSSSYIPERAQPFGYIDQVSIDFLRDHPGGPPDSDSDSDSSLGWNYSDSTRDDTPSPKLTVFDVRMMMRNLSLDESLEMIRALELLHEDKVNLQCEEEEAEALLREDEKCRVCLQRAKDSVLAPCGHKCVCSPCAIILQDKGTPRGVRNKCPICRARFTTAVKVYE